MEGACHSKADGRKRAYMIATYRLSEAGDIEVELPEMAPCGADGQACCIRKHSVRVRKMGINHPLVVVRCVTHGRCWTLYPLGFAPFLRAPLTSTAGWMHTLFAAVLLAASGQPAWPRQQRPAADPAPWWRTQTRHIARAALILGLLEADDAPALMLGVPLHTVHKAIAAFKAATGFRDRARAIASILDGADTLDRERRLRRAAQRVGALGRAWEVDGCTIHPI